MKIVFLDIDGVVATNNARHDELKRYYQEDTIEKVEAAMDKNILPFPRISMFYWPFDKRVINELYRLKKQTNCEFVLSSSWRKGRTLEELNEMFALKGLRIQLFDKTNTVKDVTRGEEIQSWIRKHYEQISNYVIIDDECDYDIIQTHPNNCINVTSDEGFTKNDCDKAIKMLNK